MIEIKCPRCGQYWYANESVEGRARLCERCRDHFQYKRRQRGFIDIPFLLVAVWLFNVDLILIVLSVLMPVFVLVMLVFGGLQFAGGMIALSWLGFTREEGLNAYLSRFTYDTDWKFGRWALLMLLSGIVCLFAAGAFLGFK